MNSRTTPGLTVMLDDASIAKIVEGLAEKLAPVLNRSAVQELLTVNQTAEKIGRSPGAVRQLIARGELPCKRNGRRVHVRVSDLQNWIDKDAA